MYRYFVLICVLLISCNDGTVLPSSSGAINEVVVVVDDHFWSDHCLTLKKNLTAQVQGIAWQEPLFDVIQITKGEFSSFFKTHRNLIIIQKGPQSKVYFDAQPFSQQQYLCIIEYQFSQDLPLLIEQYADVIAYDIQQKEKNRYLISDPLPEPLALLKSKFYINLSLPSNFSLVLDTLGFVWYEFNPKDMELIKGVFIYEIPVASAFNMDYILKKRDSVQSQYVLGPIEGSYMATERLFQPIAKTYDYNGLLAFDIKGLWKMEHAFMGGPFISKVLRHPQRQQAIVVDAFLFNPGQDKRNALQELDWLISETKVLPLE